MSDAAVFVHRLSNDREVHRRVLEEAVVLLVTVAKHKHFEHLDVSCSHFCVWQGFEQTRLCLGSILDYEFADWLLFPFGTTLIIEWFECCFEVQSHCAEAGAFEVKVELHVFFRRRVIRFKFVGLFWCRLTNSFTQFGRSLWRRGHLELCDDVFCRLSRQGVVFLLR